MRILLSIMICCFLGLCSYAIVLHQKIKHLEDRLFITQEEYDLILAVDDEHGMLSWAEKNGIAPSDMSEHDKWNASFERSQALWGVLPSGFTYPAWPSAKGQPDNREILPSMEAHLMRMQLINMDTINQADWNWRNLQRLDDYLTRHRLDDYRHDGKPDRRDKVGIYK